MPGDQSQPPKPASPRPGGRLPPITEWSEEQVARLRDAVAAVESSPDEQADDETAPAPSADD